MSAASVFFLGILLAAAGVLSPPLALLAGLIFGIAVEHPFPQQSRAFQKFLLQASVVALGFGMDLREMLRAGSSGFLYTAIGITCAMALGLLLGKLLTVGGKQSFLISVGTAICGGSAIAAVGPVIEADEEEMAIGLGTVFILNSVALLIFPFIGWRFHLSQTQFGLWAALAIHDTSSVVGAAAKYGAIALMVGTTVKLARALWIVPVTLGVAALRKSKARVQLPWFILYFCIAAVLNTYVPRLHGLFSEGYRLGRLGLAVTLFLIGTGISKKTLKQVGVRPMVQGVVLWLVVGTLTLLAIRAGWIRL
jgi:uncharacterized integral membrane protein (TIGR00698 family)